MDNRPTDEQWDEPVDEPWDDPDFDPDGDPDGSAPESDPDGSAPDFDPDDPVETDLARSVLADARVTAKGRPRRRDRATRDRIRRQNMSGRNRGGYSGPGFDPSSDPQRIGGLLGGLVDDQGWAAPLAQARVFAQWAELVGEDIAAHATPQTLADGELRITAESTAWATQLRLLSATLLARLVAELGPHVVTRLIITGPSGPSWKHGGRSVRGHRGPRDTYG